MKRTYGSVDLNDIAGKIAKDIIKKGEIGRQEHLRKQEEAQNTTEEIQCLAHLSPGSARISTLGYVGANQLEGRGRSLQLAEADLRFQLVRHLVGTKQARTWEEARDRVSKMQILVADTVDVSKPRIQTQVK